MKQRLIGKTALITLRDLSFHISDRLGLRLDVNGRRVQHGSTQTMIFKSDFLVSYVSRFMTLMPGDIISTGTPAGVALGQKPPKVSCRGRRNGAWD